MAAMKQRRRKSRKPDEQLPPGDWQSALALPPRSRPTSHPALMSSGSVNPPLPLRDPPHQARFKKAHAEMLMWTASLKNLLAHLPTRLPTGIGHNQPPPITNKDVEILDKAVVVLEATDVAPEDVKAVQSSLEKIKGRLGTYADTFFLEASKSAGKERTSPKADFAMEENL